MAPLIVEYIPAAHAEHVCEDTAPASALYFPAGQLEHADAPFSAYFPSVHVWHVERVVAPIAALYIPAGHSTQGLSHVIVAACIW